MKYKTTRKDIMTTARYLDKKVVFCNYCELWHLLSDLEPYAYNCGVYGWNFDAYSFNGIILCTGYRNTPGSRANNIRDFELKARKIWENRKYKYSTKIEKLELLRAEFARQA